MLLPSLYYLLRIMIARIVIKLLSLKTKVNEASRTWKENKVQYELAKLTIKYKYKKKNMWKILRDVILVTSDMISTSKKGALNSANWV